MGRADLEEESVKAWHEEWHRGREVGDTKGDVGEMQVPWWEMN